MSRTVRPLKGHRFHSLPSVSLRYIIKDASEAAAAMRGHDAAAEGKYADQVNDAATILAYRDRESK
jgi:thymidylate synthase ThyX